MFINGISRQPESWSDLRLQSKEPWRKGPDLSKRPSHGFPNLPNALPCRHGSIARCLATSAVGRAGARAAARRAAPNASGVPDFRAPRRALFATWLACPCTTPAPSPETPTASSNCLRPHCLCMLGSAGGFLASPVPRAAETLPAIVCPAAAHLGPAETAATLRLLRRQGW